LPWMDEFEEVLFKPASENASSLRTDGGLRHWRKERRLPRAMTNAHLPAAADARPVEKRPPSRRRREDCVDCGVDTNFSTGARPCIAISGRRSCPVPMVSCLQFRLQNFRDRVPENHIRARRLPRRRSKFVDFKRSTTSEEPKWL
jgi:hypothetical protein